MKDYLMLNGEKVELTESQIEKLKLELGLYTKNKIFDRTNGKKYYYIDCCGNVNNILDNGCEADDDCYYIANYCTDENTMKQRALHETLNRLLWRFSISNNGDKIKWDNNYYFKISYNHDTKDFVVDYNMKFQNFLSTYFLTKEIAQRAIEEVVKPFMEKHPEFTM